MNIGIETQIRAIADEAFAQTTAVDADRLGDVVASANGQTLSNKEIIMLSPNSNDSRAVPHRTKLLAIAASVVLVIAGIVAITLLRDESDREPVDQPDPSTTIDTATTIAPVDADRLPFPGGVAEPGRVATSQLGVEVAFDVPVPMSLTIGRDNQLELFAFADPVERSDLDNGFAMYRVAGLRTSAEASTPFDEASIDPLDIDRWISESGVVVLDDREIDVDDRSARVLDIKASPDALDVQPADCPPELRPCSFWAAYSGGVANPGGWISAQEPVRLYIIPIGDHDPLAIMSRGQQSDDWDDFIESTVISTMEIGPDAPPAGTS